MTCAHVVNAALERHQRERDWPEVNALVHVDFPILGDTDGAPLRICRVEAWAPPPESGVLGGDVAGLVLVGEGLPAGAAPARLIELPAGRYSTIDVFGCPSDPLRHTPGAWTALQVRGALGSDIIQLDASRDSAIRAQQGHSGSPAIVKDDAGDAVLGMLAVAGADEHTRDAYAIPAFRLIEAWPDVLSDSTVPLCPYKGLDSFIADDAEAGLFVGRDREVGELRQLISRQELVVVTGPSGVGKSSLVNAGLARAVRDEGWTVESFRPGSRPCYSLAAALFRAERPKETPTIDDLDKWVSRLRSEGLAGVGSQLMAARAAPLLLCADQLEQVLDPGTCPEEVRAEFLDLILAIQNAPEDGLRLVCTLRADFLSPLLEHRGTGARLRDCLFPLSPMDTDSLERVIAEPAAAKGVQYQRGLVPLIASDAGGGAGLPLLEFALLELWPHQQKRLISLSEYHDIGGVSGALNKYAQRVYEDLKTRYAEERVRRVMLSLVRSRGGASEATRRIVPREQLGQDWEIAEALGRKRLIVLGRDPAKGIETAEIAHEALIRQWPTLASWVNDDADFQEWRAALEERAASDGDLLHDTRLAEADRWLATRPQDIPEEVKQLVERSKSEWRRRVTELEEARNRAQEAAQRAEHAVRHAEARRLAAAAELAINSQGIPLNIPIALAIESLQTAPGLEGDIAIRRAIKRAPIQRSRLEHGGAVVAVAFSPDGSRVATGSLDGSARVFDAATGAQICRLNHNGPVLAVAFSPDRACVATGSRDNSARVFDAETGQQLWRRDHRGPVRAVAFSPDGARLATGSDDGSARVLDAVTGAQLCGLRHGGSVRAVAFSPDGARLATGSDDGSARVLDAVTGTQLCGLRHGESVRAVAFSPDGARLATGSWDRSARVIDASTGAEICRSAHEDFVHAVAFSPDGARVATGSWDECARVIDADNGEQLWRLDHRRPVVAIAFSPDGTRIATGSRDGSARVVDAATGEQLCRLDHGGSVMAVAFSPDGTRIATGSRDGSSRVMDAATGTELCGHRHGGPVAAVVFSPDGALFATGCGDDSARVIDAATGAQLRRVDHRGQVAAVAFSPDGARLATGSWDGTARLIDTATGAQVCRVHHGGPVVAVAFSPDGTRFVTGSWDRSARVIDAATGAKISHMEHDELVHAVAFSPDGSKVATGSHDRTMRVFDAVSGEQVCHVDHRGPVRAVAFSPEGTRVATGSQDRSAQVSDAACGAQQCRLGHGGPVVTVAFSPDGKHLATGSGDESARVFDVATGAQVARLDHGGPVVAVAFSPDSTRVATGSWDCTARVWNAASGVELCRLEHDSDVNAVAFSPDGARLVTGSDDHVARVWAVQLDQLIAQAHGRLTKNLTQQEWRRYFGDEPYRKTVTTLP